MGGCIPSKKESPEPVEMNDLDCRTIIVANLSARQVQIPNEVSRYENISSPHFDQISKDIERTFPAEKYFQDRRNLAALERVLKEFAVYLPEVGYTQGLNYVGGYLLLFGVREIDTLRCLIGLNLHEDLMLMGLYTDLFPLCQLYCSLFWVALSQMMPPLYDTLRKDAELQDYVWLYPWFLTLFIRELPIQYIKHILVFITQRKNFGIVVLALAIVRISKDQLMAGKDCLQYIRSLRKLSFCQSHLPIKQLLSAASTISNEQMVQCLGVLPLSDNTDWYQQYFAKEGASRHTEHAKVMKTLQREQLNYESIMASGMDVKKSYESLKILEMVFEEHQPAIAKPHQWASCG